MRHDRDCLTLTVPDGLPHGIVDIQTLDPLHFNMDTGETFYIRAIRAALKLLAPASIVVAFLAVNGSDKMNENGN